MKSPVRMRKRGVIKKMIKRTKLVPFLLLAIFSLQLQTTARQPQSSDVIPSNAVLIRNGGNRQIIFWLRNGNGPWVKFWLDAGDNRPYKNVDQIWIRTTGQEPVQYKLELNQRYKIVWDGTRWVVVRIDIRS